MKITFPYRATIPLNSAYWNHGHRRVITKQARELRQQIEDDIPDNLVEDAKKYHAKPLMVVLKVTERWKSKKNTILKKDIANREKFFIDSVFQYLGLQDENIFDLRLVKVHNPEYETTELVVYTLG